VAAERRERSGAFRGLSDPRTD